MEVVVSILVKKLWFGGVEEFAFGWFVICNHDFMFWPFVFARSSFLASVNEYKDSYVCIVPCFSLRSELVVHSTSIMRCSII